MPSCSANVQSKDNKQEGRYSWWSWRRTRPSRETTPASDVMMTTTETAPKENVVTEIKEVEEIVIAKVDVTSEL